MSYCAVYPPSRTSMEPVTKRASSEQGYCTAAMCSSGLPIRPTGIIDVSCSNPDCAGAEYGRQTITGSRPAVRV